MERPEQPPGRRIRVNDAAIHVEDNDPVVHAFDDSFTRNGDDVQPPQTSQGKDDQGNTNDQDDGQQINATEGTQVHEVDRGRCGGGDGRDEKDNTLPAVKTACAHKHAHDESGPD